MPISDTLTLDAPAVAAPAPAADRRRWWILATMTGALSMIMIDQTVVSVALPTIQHDLGLSVSGGQWVVNAYLLVLAVLVALGGRVADLLGAERTFRVGTALFVAASALCGLAGSGAEIVAARGLQGLGAAMLVPSTGALVIDAFDVRERGKAMGVYSGVSMLFLALGPLVGGLLTEDVSWRAVFYVNLPIGLLMLAAAHVTLPRRPRPRIARDAIDWLGIPLLIGALGSLTLALMQSQAWGWGSPATVALLASAALLGPLFVWHERRAAAPLVQLRLFSLPNFAPDAAILAGVQFALVGASVFGAAWSQHVLGFSAIHAGVAMLPLTIPLLVTAPLAGRLYDRVGVKPLLAIGAALISLGLAWLAAHLHERDYDVLIAGYALMGAGVGLVMSPGSTDALGAASQGQRSQASGIVQTVRQSGGVVGVAILGTIVAHLSAVAPDATPAAHVDAATDAVSAAYWTGAATMAAMALLGLLWLRRPSDPVGPLT